MLQSWSPIFMVNTLLILCLDAAVTTPLLQVGSFFPRVTLEQPCTSFLLSLPLVSFSKPWNQSCPSYLKPKRVLILQLIHSGTEIPFVANSEDTPMK